MKVRRNSTGAIMKISDKATSRFFSRHQEEFENEELVEEVECGICGSMVFDIFLCSTCGILMCDNCTVPGKTDVDKLICSLCKSKPIQSKLMGF